MTLARFHEAQLLIGHIVDRPEMPRQVPLTDEDQALIDRFVERRKEMSKVYLGQLRARLSLDFEARLRVNDDVAAALHAMVEEESIDLVVLSAHGYSGQTKWPFGSVTNHLPAYFRPLIRAQLRYNLTLDFHNTTVRPIQAAYQLQHRRLAGTGRSH